jgi:hypothetical protein
VTAVADDIPFDQVNDNLGDIRHMVGNSFHVPRDAGHLDHPAKIIWAYRHPLL